MIMNFIFEKVNWMDVENYLKEKDIIIVSLGACEQHGYLSLLTDVIVPLKIAEIVSKDEKIMITPALPYGVSPFFEAYPGTISFKPETFMQVVREIIDSLIRQGFHKILLNNGHGGNTKILDWLILETCNNVQNIKISLFEWWKHPIVKNTIQEMNLKENHANWSENFPSTRVTPVPSIIKEEIGTWPRFASAKDYREFLGDGSFGGQYQVSDEIMDQIFAKTVMAMKSEIKLLY